MRFSTVFSVLTCGAMALAAAVAPDALVSRSNDEISGVLSILGGKCDSILPLFDECKDSKCTEGLVSEIVEVVEGTIADLVDLDGVLSLSLAKQVVAIVDRIVSKLDLLKSSCDGKCEGHGVFVKIDLCLSSLLKQLGICVPGILKLVSKLLDGLLGGLLGGLGLTGLLGLL